MPTVLLLSGAAMIAFPPAAGAAVIDVAGNGLSGYTDETHNLNFIVGPGNSGRLTGDFFTHWSPGSGSFSVPVDTNGFTLNLDNGNGNGGHVASGPISGAGSLVVTAGPFSSPYWETPYTIGGASSNTYAGTTEIRKGMLMLDKTAGADALLGTITIGSSDQTARVVWNADDQINDMASVTLTLPAVSGGFAPDANLNFLDLGGFSDTIGSLVLEDDGTRTQVRTGDGGILTVSSLTVGGVPLAAGIYTSADGFVTGSGSVVVIPETSSVLLGSLGLLALFRRRR